MKSTNILLIGAGAREHALARAFCRSPQSVNLFCYAEVINPGIKKLVSAYGVGAWSDTVAWAEGRSIDFVVVGPEAPLAAGLADEFWAAGIPVIGPTKQLAEIESSKAFARDLLQKYHLAGAVKYRQFTTLSGAADFLAELGTEHYVVKANGLMGGKGVKVAGEHLHTFSEALEFCQQIIDQQIIDQQQTFVVEEKLVGQEFSLLSFCDGQTVIPMPCVQDHKRAFAGDLGPNTGGMGSYSDANHRLPFLTAADVKMAQKINQDVIHALQQECGGKYIGILYGSYIATRTGVSVIEFNARFGDPEAMNVLALLQTDLVAICQAMLNGALAKVPVQFAPKATVCKYAVPEGYPDARGVNADVDISGVKNPDQLYLASVVDVHGQLRTAGSRTLAVVGVAETIAEAEAIAEAEIQRVQGAVVHRADIGTEQLIAQKILHMQQLRQA